MSILLIFLIAFIIFSSFVIASYPFLKWSGVKTNLWSRSLKFGAAISGIWLLTQIPFKIIFGGFFGLIFGFLATYFYIKAKLDLTSGKNLIIVFLLPILAGIIATPLLITVFKKFST